MDQPWIEIAQALGAIRILLLPPRPLTLVVHETVFRLAEGLGYTIYDVPILASAPEAGRDTLLLEDLQHGQMVEGRLTVRNPFSPARSASPLRSSVTSWCRTAPPARRALPAGAAVYATRARGEGTLRAYRSAWSASLGREPLADGPATLAVYAICCVVSSLRVHLAAPSQNAR